MTQDLGASPNGDRVLSPAATEPEVSAHSGDAPLRTALALVPHIDVNTAGELLRELSFVRPYGAYSCFDLRDGFVKQESDLIPLKVRTALAGCFAKDPNTIESMAHHGHVRLPLAVYWHWDGDGTLAFSGPGFLIHNGDCKHGDEWEAHKPGDWLDEYLANPDWYENWK